LSLTANADARALPPSAGLSLAGDQADIGAVVEAVTGQPLIAGRGNFSVVLNAQGQTQEEIVGTLKGSASASLGEGLLKGVNLTALLTAVSERILDGWGEAKGETPLTSMTLDASIADGIVEFTQFSLAAPGVTLATNGAVDLLRQAIDVGASPQFEGTGSAPAIHLPVPVVIRGPWAAPRIYPEVDRILEDPKDGYERLKAMKQSAGN
jgi:AsmA protein